MNRDRRSCHWRLARQCQHWRTSRQWHRKVIQLWAGVITATVALSLCPSVQGQSRPNSVATGSNIALGAKYQLTPAPNYAHCTDPGDATQLTDGRLTDGYFWTQSGTVGWSHAKYAAITIDLGDIRPIGGLSFRTAAGVAGVTWPAAIRIHVSDDGKLFRDLGDLLALDDEAGSLPLDKYAVRRFATSRLAARGRYVRLLVIPTGPFIFVDEIEVLRGDESLLASAPAAPTAGDLEQCYLGYKVNAGMGQRFRADLASMEKSIRDSGLDANVTQTLGERVEALRPKLTAAAARPIPADFKAILPFNADHAELFRVQAALWKAKGHADLSAWPVCPWDPQELFAMPRDGGPSMTVHTMVEEYRAAAFNLANSTDASLHVAFRVQGLPGGSAPSFITAYRVPWTDTVSGRPVAAALMELGPHEGSWSLEVPPGLVQQVWLTFHVTDVPAGQHAGEIVIDSPGKPTSLPLQLHVYPMHFPERTTLWVGGWSYTDGEGKYGMTRENREEFINHLRSRFVNAPWATAAVLMKFTLSQADPPAFQLDTARLDDWLNQWPDARAYLVFVSVGREFAGAAIGTPEFKQRVGSGISAWVRHLAAKRIAANRLGLLLVDEPRAREQDETIVPWAKAIHAAEPEVLVWEDPIYRNPSEGSPRMYEVSDILCPNRPMWLAASQPFADFYLDQQKKGKTLQFYSCSGPARLLDPYAYYRLQAWHSRQIGATGSFFWAFGDNGKASSWNEYASTGPYTPLFLDAHSVTPAKQMEAIRESVEDFEYFVMLDKLVERAVAQQKTGPALDKARTLLRTAPDRVLTAESAINLTWHAPKDRTLADQVRLELLEAMSRLSQ